MIQNSKGSLYYGLHFYPGVARYAPEGEDAYTIFLSEETIRKMDPSFAGRPVFVQHVDEVAPSLDELREEADGWVIESFYNKADGKHWIKFVVVSDKAEEAIRSGMFLSNCYIPKSFGGAGTWNGIDYDKEVKDAEYEHMAIVPNPRYEESIILTPEKFKRYNDEKLAELERVANNKDTKQGVESMKLNFFKKSKVENALDLEETMVVLPKSGKEVTIKKLVNDADEHEMKHKDDDDDMAGEHHHVMVGEHKMNVHELAKKYMDAMEEMEKMKKVNDEHGDESAKEHAEEKKMDAEDPDEDKEAKKKALELAEHEQKEIEEKHKNAIAKAERLKTANARAHVEPVKVELLSDRVARGKARYGSK